MTKPVSYKQVKSNAETQIPGMYYYVIDVWNERIKKNFSSEKGYSSIDLSEIINDLLRISPNCVRKLEYKDQVEYMKECNYINLESLRKVYGKEGWSISFYEDFPQFIFAQAENYT